MAITVKDRLNTGSAADLADRLLQIKMGDFLAGMVPREIIRTSLTSQATHIEPEAGIILSLSDGTDEYLIAPVDGGTPLAKGALANGVATIVYDSEGVASITFEGVKTAYTVIKTVFPVNLGTLLAKEV